MSNFSKIDLVVAANDWRRLAAEQVRLGDHEASMGRFRGVYDNRAELYGRTARSLDLEVETGDEHCVCCLKQHCSNIRRSR